MLPAWASARSVRIASVRIPILLCMLLLLAADATAQTPWTPTNYANGVPWAPNTVAVPSLANSAAWNATAAIGVDPPATQTWGPAYTFNLASGQSFSYSGTTPAPYTPFNGVGVTPTAPLNRTYNPDVAAGSLSSGSFYYFAGSSVSTSNVGGYYPGGSNNQPTGSATNNINNLTFPVASRVLANTSSAGTTYTDPYSGNAIVTAGSSGSNFFQPGTTAAIIAGTYVPDGSGKPLTMQWRSRGQNEIAIGSGTNQNLPNGSAYLASDVMKLSGQAPGADFVLEMDFSPEVEHLSDQPLDIQANKALYLGMLVNQSGITTWANAVSENVANTVYTTTTDNYTGIVSLQAENLPAVGAFAWNPSATSSTSFVGGVESNQPFLGSFQSFLNSTYQQGGQTHYFYEHSLDELRGTWGIDTSTDTAWAVLDVGNGIFAVVPEPATIRLVAGCLMTAGIGVWWRRRKRIKAAKAAEVAKLAKPRSVSQAATVRRAAA